MLAYLDNELTEEERRETVRYMKQYKALEAIIKSKELELMPSHTTTFVEDKAQASNSFYSEPEKYAIKSEEIDYYINLKAVLDIAYKSVKPLQKAIWDEHFIDGFSDKDVYYGREISKSKYYKEKNELIKIVAECLRASRTKDKKRTKKGIN